jgi:hypothetical protein
MNYHLSASFIEEKKDLKMLHHPSAQAEKEQKLNMQT